MHRPFACEFVIWLAFIAILLHASDPKTRGVDVYIYIWNCTNYFISNKLIAHPKVHKNNTCTLAELIRASYRREMSPPALQGLTPLQLLVEIGIEKLRRDYRNAFLGTCTWTTLWPSLPCVLIWYGEKKTKRLWGKAFSIYQRVSTLNSTFRKPV